MSEFVLTSQGNTVTQGGMWQVRSFWGSHGQEKKKRPKYVP